MNAAFSQASLVLSLLLRHSVLSASDQSSYGMNANSSSQGPCLDFCSTCTISCSSWYMQTSWRKGILLHDSVHMEVGERKAAQIISGLSGAGDQITGGAINSTRGVLSSVLALLSVNWSLNPQIEFKGMYLVSGERSGFEFYFETCGQKERFRVGRAKDSIHSQRRPWAKRKESSKEQAHVKSIARQWHRSGIIESLPDKKHWLYAHSNGHMSSWSAIGTRFEQVFSVPTLNFRLSVGGDNKYILLWSSKWINALVWFPYMENDRNPKEIGLQLAEVKRTY